MKPKKEKWTQEQADVTMSLVYAIAVSMVNKKIRGEEYHCKHFSGVVQKKRVIAILNWIIHHEITNGFKSAVTVEFEDGEAVIVGLCLGDVLREFPNILCETAERTGIPLPIYGSGWESSCKHPWIKFSALIEQEGAVESAVICVHGHTKNVKHEVWIDDIPGLR